MKTYIHIVLALVFATTVLTFSACHKKNKDAALPPPPVADTYNPDLPPPIAPPNSVFGTLQNKRTLDGCGWMIMLDDGTKLQPLNLVSFKDLAPVEGKRVILEYEKQDGAMTTCMSGKTVKITTIKEIK